MPQTIPDAGVAILLRHVNPSPPLDCIGRLTTLIAAGDWGAEVGAHVGVGLGWGSCQLGGVFQPERFRSSAPTSDEQCLNAVQNLQTALHKSHEVPELGLSADASWFAILMQLLPVILEIWKRKSTP